MKNFNFLENTTAIIVLYGENEKILGRNLDNLKNIKKIIIDNGCDKQLKKKIISKYNVEKYILNERNIGYSAACNQGLRLSDSRFSLVINPDCIITEKNLIKSSKTLYQERVFGIITINFVRSIRCLIIGVRLLVKGI